MAKTALVAGEPANGPGQNQIVTRVSQTYENARGFLTDVRAEMRKVADDEDFAMPQDRSYRHGDPIIDERASRQRRVGCRR